MTLMLANQLFMHALQKLFFARLISDRQALLFWMPADSCEGLSAVMEEARNVFFSSICNWLDWGCLAALRGGWHRLCRCSRLKPLLQGSLRFWKLFKGYAR
ncbi:hypothetical protein PPS11_19434 [Pseudomonas putida S11]|nr:hypothetical protein PPS11_19434 [Pseudomonas putida S11]